MIRRHPFLRVAFLCAVAILLVSGLASAWFQSWKAGRIVDLHTGAEIADLPSGKMEYSLHGEGVPVVVFHSAPGGYDQGLAIGGFLTDAGFEIVSPSRPGYLRTPLNSGPSPAEQADAVSWLLEELEVDRVAVLGFGHGGPAALEFTRKYSPRIHALVLVSAITTRLDSPDTTPLPLQILRTLRNDFRSCLFVEMARRLPSRALAAAAPFLSPGSPVEESAWGSAVLQDSAQLDDFQQFANALSPLSLRETGTANDLLQVESLALIPLADIRTPTLVVHGAMDRFVPQAMAQATADSIPGAELLIVPGGGHLPTLGNQGDSVRERIVSFLKQHTLKSPEAAE
jgi:pimeloyl-ACP methyl ester carboxylesterase